MIAYITVKGNSVRCPRKNHTLLPYVLSYARELFDVIVITDDDELESIAKEYGVRVYRDKNTHKISELHAIYGYLKEHDVLNIDEEFVLLPVTQPFRTEKTIKEVMEYDMSFCDVVTTYTKVSNRGIFILDDKDMFKYESYNRKGCMCNVEKMADGSMYKLRNSFLKYVVESEDTNHAFWHGKMKFVENTHPIFLDVDEPKDLELFNFITNK